VEGNTVHPLIESADPTTSASRLRELAQNPCEIVRRRVARHRNTPGETLLALLDDQDCWVAWNLAQNKAASAELLDELVSRRLFLDKVAANRNAPARLLSQLAREPDEGVRAAAANNPSTPASALNELAGDIKPRVRWCVARNTAAPPEVLEKLARDSEEKVRRAVARNRNTPKPLKMSLKQTLGIR
jgi:hypothetical protein